MTDQMEEMPSPLDGLIEFDSRRLTGLNFYAHEPLAIIELCLPEDRTESILDLWRKKVLELHVSMGRESPTILDWRIHAKGQCVFFNAPIDALYAATELNELAMHNAITGDKHPEQQSFLDRLTTSYKSEANSKLLSLQKAARDKHQAFLWDDDLISVGFGKHMQSWLPKEIPPADEITHPTKDAIPLAVITGTNGKSTSTRLCSKILLQAGLTTGFSSTDGVWAGTECLDTGDYSGPGGARMVLRNKNVQAAILEVARGGLLRRGLGIDQADVALITNVAEDHLGEYGVNDLQELIHAKFIVAKAVSSCGTLILNADDQGIVEYAGAHEEIRKQTKLWFSQDSTNPVIEAQLTEGKRAFFIKDGQLCEALGEIINPICAVNDIPITLGGAAKYNISNALGAAALCWQLGASIDAIRSGLKDFTPTPENNPGRGNFFDIKQRSIMMDFAHNPHGVSAVVDTVLQLPAKRRLIMLGHPGDRDDDSIRASAKAAMKLNPATVVVYETEAYLRGRVFGDVSRIMSEALIDLGLSETQILSCDDAASATNEVLEWSQPDDALLLLVLDQRDEVLANIRAFEQAD